MADRHLVPFLLEPSDFPLCRVADQYHFNADPDPAFHLNADPDPALHFGADPDLAPLQSDWTLRPLVHI
jgi:hypothetical protein